MSKREGNSTRGTKVKKRRGVGSRTIRILDSDEDNPPPVASDDYARVTKTRVGISGKAERLSMTSVPILEVEKPTRPAPLEENEENSANITVENVVPVKPAKQRKTINDTVSDSNHIYPSASLTTI